MGRWDGRDLKLLWADGNEGPTLEPLVTWASLWFEKKTEFLDNSSKIVDILPVFLEPKWNPTGDWCVLVYYVTFK